VIVATNLFRDQLDRYGEVQRIVDCWRETLREAGGGATFVYCGDDPRLAMLAAGIGARTVSFGLDAGAAGAGSVPASTAADPVSCERCGRPLEVASRTIGHLGRFRCPAGHVRWRPSDVRFALLDAGDASLVRVTAGPDARAFRFALSGLSFGYDAAAAIAATTALGVPLATATTALADATAAFGRSEELDVDGRRVVLALAKNPASLGEASRLAERLRPDATLLALNDAFADGRDVSWIWDAEIGALLAATTLVVSGTRAGDLGLRVKYDPDGRGSGAGGEAGAVAVVPDLDAALSTALAATEGGGTLLVVATYTALLALRDRLVRSGHAVESPA
jgi:UDP-N-acetylmuramyl tripeptide synthase